MSPKQPSCQNRILLQTFYVSANRVYIQSCKHHIYKVNISTIHYMWCFTSEGEVQLKWNSRQNATKAFVNVFESNLHVKDERATFEIYRILVFGSNSFSTGVLQALLH